MSEARVGRIVLGLDGGGTRTRLAAVTSEGELVAWREAGGMNFRTIGWDGVRETLTALGRDWGAKVAMLGVAGAAQGETQKRIQEMVMALGWAERVVVDHDLRVAWAGALAGQPGVIAIAGTGAACFGVNAVGETWRAGGWSWESDNQGGGYALAVAAQAAVWRARDGRGPATALADALPEPASWERLSRVGTARLARVVVQLAEQGDAVAREVVQQQADALAEATAAVAVRLGMETGPVSYAGSWLERSAFYRDLFATALRARLPAVEMRAPRWPPVVGAVWLASSAAGWAMREALMDRCAECCGRKTLTAVREVV
ncbi:MAG: hypothetical protein NZ483_01705 [Verrucomicrobiae bacterium]|nr:hypothetical protein [Verrucomicrobiae bacterium]